MSDTDKFKKRLRKELISSKPNCWWCGVQVSDDMIPLGLPMATLDHLIPQAERPDLKTDRSNIVLSCNKCNHARGNEYNATRQKNNLQAL